MTEETGADPCFGPDDNPWYSPGPCPDCLIKFKKNVWLLRVTIGNPGHTISHECKVCGYTLPMTYDGFTSL